jgi:CRISP-associated protein Cas1
LYGDGDRRLELVKAIVTAKIHNQGAVLYRHKVTEHSLKLRKAGVSKQGTIDQVRGVEGLFGANLCLGCGVGEADDYLWF